MVKVHTWRIVAKLTLVNEYIVLMSWVTVFRDGTMACGFSILISPQKSESPTIDIGRRQPVTQRTMKVRSFSRL